MCNCVEPPQGLKAVAPNPENAAEYKDTYGEMVKVQYVSEFAPVSPTTLRGANTRVNYGQRAQNDVFHIWEADFVQGEFQRVDVYEAEPAQKTVVPPPPAPLEASSVDDNSEPVKETPKANNAPKKKVPAKKIGKAPALVASK